MSQARCGVKSRHNRPDLSKKAFMELNHNKRLSEHKTYSIKEFHEYPTNPEIDA